MGSSNWRAALGQTQIPGDWRTQLLPGPRQMVVSEIMETLKRRVPFPTQDGLLLELKKIAVRFEEKIYTEATSQDDYLRKIASKMLAIESQSRNPIANSPV